MFLGNWWRHNLSNESRAEARAEVTKWMGERGHERWLPEVLTSLHTVKSAAQRNAQPAADCHEVDRVVGMADIDNDTGNISISCMQRTG